MKQRLGLGLIFTLALCALTTVACSTLKQVAVQPVKVEGTAMRPTLNDGDRIFISRSFEKLERGDIVLFYYPDDPSKSYIKRVIGLPGEKLEIREGKVLVNGQNLAEPYVDPNNNLSSRTHKIALPPDNFYVIGDNRDNSYDPRSWGALPRKFIYGKFVSKYYAAE